jgi:hypothetical protein
MIGAAEALPLRPPKPQFGYPRRDQHTVIVGQNGSGKTQMGFHLLSRAPIHDMPWIIVDTKREPLFKRLEKRNAIVSRLKPGSRAPKAPGLHIIRPDEADDEEFDGLLERCYRKGEIGFYFDEAYAIPDGKNSALHKILTQGRSRHLPTIALIQRPVLVDHFFLSEAKHLCYFKLIDRKDRQEMSRYMPIDIDAKIPRYHSLWYDNSRDLLFRLPPVPSADAIVDAIVARAPRHWWWG